MSDAALRHLRVNTFGRPLPVLAAQRLGFLRDQGLEVEYVQARGSVEQIRQVLAGQWDFVHTAVDNVMAYDDAEGVDLFVFMVLELGLEQKLIVRPEIQGYQDLRGQTLGVDALATGYAFVLRKMLQLNGISLDEYEFVSIGGTAERAEALLEGKIVAALLGPPHDEKALLGGCALLEPASQYFPVYPGLTGGATRRWEQQDDHKDVLVRYVRALAQGEHWAGDPANRDQAIALLAEDRGLHTARAAAQYEIESSGRTRLPGLDVVEESIRIVGALRREMTGQADRPLDISRYWDPSYMRAAL
jgi:ABC-type nitrate/sulfonate/bicarbonate transport system substrate-binding protein